MAEVGGGRGRALLLIDFQRDFLDPKGRMPVDQLQVEPVIAAAQLAADAAQTQGDLIVKIATSSERVT
jgi:nicotinamidase-related amidase